MMTNTRTEHKRDPALEDFAAEMPQAVYPIVLRQRPKGSWLDLELNLWSVLYQMTLDHGEVHESDGHRHAEAPLAGTAAALPAEGSPGDATALPRRQDGAVLAVG